MTVCPRSARLSATRRPDRSETSRSWEMPPARTTTVRGVTESVMISIQVGRWRGEVAVANLFDLVRTAVAEVAPLDTIPGVRILPSALSDEGPLIGAAGLVHRAELLP